MKVYIVTGSGWHCHSTYGVYANRIDAQKRCDEINYEYRYDNTYKAYVTEYEVIEHEDN